MSKTNTRKLIEKLNSDLAGELQAIIQYLQHAYHIAGSYSEPSRAHFSCIWLLIFRMVPIYGGSYCYVQ